MSADIFDFAKSKAIIQGRKVPVVIIAPLPQETIIKAADLSMADYLASIGELCIRHITENDTPLPPPVRAVVMQAVAALRGQPL